MKLSTGVRHKFIPNWTDPSTGEFMSCMSNPIELFSH